MIRAIIIVLFLIFVLYFFKQGEYVEKTVTFTKEQAEYAQQHGLKGLASKYWCGSPTCFEEGK